MKELIEGEEVKGGKLAKIQTVEEMIPAPADNQISKGTLARIGEEQYKIIEEYLMMDATIEEACMAAGISVPAYYKHKEKNPEFSRRMAIAREYPKVVARAAVMKRIRLGDARTALEYLKLRDKRYNQNSQEETETSSAPVVQFISVASEGATNTTNPDSQNDIKQRSASTGYGNTSEKLTPRENEEQALRNLDSLDFSNE